jgi:hypothetical protein
MFGTSPREQRGARTVIPVADGAAQRAWRDGIRPDSSKGPA